jgi:hypothetical protein
MTVNFMAVSSARGGALTNKAVAEKANGPDAAAFPGRVGRGALKRL